MHLKTLCKSKATIVCKNANQFDRLVKALNEIGFADSTIYEDESEKGRWPSWATNEWDTGFVTVNPATKTYDFVIAMYDGGENVEFEKIEDFQWEEGTNM